MTEREALKLTLAALKQIDEAMPFPVAKLAIMEAEKALAQPEQEPVAWRGYNWGHSPDDWVYRDFDDPILDGNGNNVGQPLYTTPPQRTWVGLNWDDLPEIYVGDTAFLHGAKWAEAKLREKNSL